MKAKIPTLLSIILIMAIAAVSAPASQTIVAEIPFDFVVGRKTLPAGKYRVRMATDFNARVLVVESLENSARAVVSTTAGELTPPDAVETLVFNRYGDTYYLASVGPRGMAACNVRMSSAEQQLARSGAAREPVALTVGSR